MEMRAEADVDVGKDITPAILPLAFALSDSFLSSHCSSCFRPLNPSPVTPSHLSSHAHCNSHIRYCSLACHSADYHLHVSSGECHLLQSQSNASWHGHTTDLRVALRLLASWGDSAAPAVAERIGGLMTNRRRLEEDEEISETIRDGGRMMSLTRRGRPSGGEEGEERVDCSMEEDVLCLVLTNGVEVQVGEGRAIGTAVYGPRFSWFNHSCAPNACYRFSLTGPGELDSGGTDFLVSAGSKDTTGNVINLYAASCLDYNYCKDECYKELNGRLYQALEDISFRNPEACYKRLELILAEGFKVERLQQQETLPPKFKLHPLHHLSLGSYISLSSAYKICANSLLVHASDADNQHDALRLRRAAAACSLLLAGATHHFFSLEASLIASAAHFWTNAGETLLALVSGSSWSAFAKQRSKSDSSTVLSWLNDECLLVRELNAYLSCSQTRMHNDSLGEFHKICQGFFYCVQGMLSKLWPVFIHDLDYLKAIEDPVDFRWLGLVSLQQLDEAQMVVSGEESSCVCGQIDEVEENSLLELAVHCLLFGGYLSGICYSEHGYLSMYIRSLLRAQKETLLGKSNVPRTG
ncbi:hypothetical protein ACLOJK_031176 [Asimina triloba]